MKNPLEGIVRVCMAAEMYTTREVCMALHPCLVTNVHVPLIFDGQCTLQSTHTAAHIQPASGIDID